MMSTERAEEIRDDAVQMLRTLKVHPELRKIYSDVNFYKMIRQMELCIESSRTVFEELNDDEVVEIERMFAEELSGEQMKTDAGCIVVSVSEEQKRKNRKTWERLMDSKKYRQETIEEYLKRHSLVGDGKKLD